MTAWIRKTRAIEHPGLLAIKGPSPLHVTEPGLVVPHAGLVPMTTVASSSSKLATRGVSPLRAKMSALCGA